MASDNYKQVELAIKNHSKFYHRVKGDENTTFSQLEGGRYKVRAVVDGYNMLLLDILGDKVLHVNKTYYNDTILKVQKIISKYYH